MVSLGVKESDLNKSRSLINQGISHLGQPENIEKIDIRTIIPDLIKSNNFLSIVDLVSKKLKFLKSM